MSYRGHKGQKQQNGQKGNKGQKGATCLCENVKPKSHLCENINLNWTDGTKRTKGQK